MIWVPIYWYEVVVQLVHSGVLHLLSIVPQYLCLHLKYGTGYAVDQIQLLFNYENIGKIVRRWFFFLSYDLASSNYSRSLARIFPFHHILSLALNGVSASFHCFQVFLVFFLSVSLFITLLTRFYIITTVKHAIWLVNSRAGSDNPAREILNRNSCT
jgi:hypothetical protein